jgi:hypothetical protein
MGDEKSGREKRRRKNPSSRVKACGFGIIERKKNLIRSKLIISVFGVRERCEGVTLSRWRGE